jgi:hypothetical protein
MNDTYNNTYINTNTSTGKKIKDSEHIKDVEDDEDNKDIITSKMKNLLDSFSFCNGIEARINRAIEIFTYILTIPKFMSIQTNFRVTTLKKIDEFSNDKNMMRTRMFSKILLPKLRKFYYQIKLRDDYILAPNETPKIIIVI